MSDIQDSKTEASDTERNIGRTTFKLAVLSVAMFAFAFVVMVPLYNVLCDITGLNGKTENSAAQVNERGVDTSRTIRVTFTATNNEQMPWEFRPGDVVLEVHPGEAVTTHFYARNTTQRDMVSQSIPSVAPSVAAQYFHKTECFCFNNQPLEAGESAELGLQFYVDKELPKSVKNITLAYTIFDITQNVSPENVTSEKERSNNKIADAG